MPTPLQFLPRLSEALGAEIWVKRDDLTGLGLSGNKVRKLSYLLREAQSVGADVVLTTGGLQSNHCRATAVAARQLGMEPALLLRGSAPAVAESNLLLDRLLGAEVRTCTADDYRNRRDELLRAWADEFSAAGRVPYVVPEGGSNALGLLGYAEAAQEVRTQAGRAFDHHVVAVGSGGTLAGLAVGGLDGQIHGVAVCDDRATFEARVVDMASGARPWLARGLAPHGDGWEVTEGYQGPAYAVATEETWQAIRTTARCEGLLLDPVYTGKAMEAVFSEVRAGRWGGRILFWHTGGAFGLFGRGAEIEPVR